VVGFLALVFAVKVGSAVFDLEVDEELYKVVYRVVDKVVDTVVMGVTFGVVDLVVAGSDQTASP